MEFKTTRERELFLTGALTMAGLMSTATHVDHNVVARQFKAMQDFLGLGEEQVRTTVKPGSFALKDLISSFTQTPVDTLQ